ncbi:MAG: hypothetical protein ACNA8R_09305 [Nitriliruptoraceae bacterium]
MPDQLEPYRAALEDVAAAAHGAAHDQLGCPLPPIRMQLVAAPPGAERLMAVPPDTVELAVSDPGQLRPPPAGANTIYGVCHEIGHLVLALATPRWRQVPVVWDEAFAHLLAVDVLLPAVWAAHGATLWPDPYPDYPTRELQVPAGSQGLDGGTMATLERSTTHLRRIAARVGVAGLLASLGRIAPHQLTVTELGPALRRETEGQTPAGSV